MMSSGSEQEQLRALLAQAQARLVEKNLLVGHKHISLFVNFNVEGERVTAWALVTGLNFLYQILDYDLVADWLHMKGFEPYFAGQIDCEMNSLDDPATGDVAFYAVPNKVWRSTRFIMDENGVEK